MPRLKVFDHKLVELYWNPEIGLFEEVFKPTTSEACDEEIMEVQRTKLEYYLKYNYEMKHHLCDTTYFFIELKPATQKWIDDNILSFLDQVDTIKVAFVLSQGFMEQLSVESTMKESPHPYETRYFPSYDEARKWITSK